MLLSKSEDLVYQELKKNGFIAFRIKDARLLLHWKTAKVYNIIKALKKKGAIKKVNGFFVFADAEAFAIGCGIHYPSYISFWSALHYYGWSDQTPKKIFLATTKYAKDIDSFKYATLGKNRFFGYTRIGDFAMAEKEKAIIDSLLFPKYSGGMREIKNSLNIAFQELDEEKLLFYAFKVKKKVVIRRLGFLLEKIGYKKLDKLKRHIGKGYELLDPTLKRKNQLNKTWLLDINWR